MGFVLSEEVEAEFENSPEYGIVYYINPCVIGKRSIRRRWKKGIVRRARRRRRPRVRPRGTGPSYHGEDYAGRLTEVVGMVLNHWRRFTRHFR